MKPMYYIALLPPTEIRKEIKSIKTEIREQFGSAHALRSPAHITLQMPFHFEADKEIKLAASLKHFAAGIRVFNCDTADFDHFGNRVVFVSVKPNHALSSTRKALQELLKEEFGFTEKKLPARFHPHITIANRDLFPEQFEACWAVFKDRSYRKSFKITHLTLLKHHGDHWEVHLEFPMAQHV